MNNQREESIKEFEAESESILKSLVLDQGFQRNQRRITSFIEENSLLCSELINNNQSKTCLFILNKLYNICVEILRGFPVEIDPKGAIRHFFTQLRLKEKTNKAFSASKPLNIPNLIFLLQSYGSLKDIVEIKNPEHFQYYLIAEYFLVTVNNLAQIQLKRNKPDLSKDFLLRAMECLSLLNYSSYYIKYHITTVAVNLVYLVEENFREESSQLLCNAALYLENLEKELDKHPLSKNIYEYLNGKSNSFVLFVEMGNFLFGQKVFENKKSFLIARMCILMAYYGDLLDELGQRQESDVARQHTRALEQQLQRLEDGAGRTIQDRNTAEKKSVTPPQKKNKEHDDNESIHSFKTAKTGFTTGSTLKDGNVPILKENIIYQKYVEVNEVKFKIVMIHLKELQSVQIIVYSKPRNLLQKVFVHFKDVSDYAKKHNMSMSNDEDANKILKKIAKLLHFKENDLLMRDIRYFRTLEELKSFTFRENAL